MLTCRSFLTQERGIRGAFYRVDYMLLLIPVVFIALRLPSCFIAITFA